MNPAQRTAKGEFIGWGGVIRKYGIAICRINFQVAVGANEKVGNLWVQA